MSVKPGVVRARGKPLILLALTVVLASAAVGVLHWTRMSAATRGGGLAPAPWPEIQVALTAAERSRQYQEGGRYLADTAWQRTMRGLDPSKVGKEDLRKLEACRYHRTVALLLSLNPQQKDELRRTGRLSFARLDQRQQQMLLSKLEGDPTSVLRRRAPASFIILVSYSQSTGGQGIMFNWLVKAGAGDRYSGMGGSLTPQY